MDSEYQHLPRGYAQVETSTSKGLQILIQFNIYLSVIFIVMETVVLQHKLKTYEMVVFGRVLAPLTFVVWAGTEVFRLWFGFTGNLQEKLPQLSVFFLITVFPQLPCIVYIMHLQPLVLPFEQTVGLLVLSLNVAELMIAYTTVRSLIKKQTRSYSRLVEEMDTSFETK